MEETRLRISVLVFIRNTSAVSLSSDINQTPIWAGNCHKHHAKYFTDYPNTRRAQHPLNALGGFQYDVYNNDVNNDSNNEICKVVF
jgi:hypothetical protein